MITRIKTPMSKKMSAKYIEFYCNARENDYGFEVSRAKAWQDFQSYVIDKMIATPALINVIATAYDNVKQDKSLHQKALITYDLSTCSEDVKNKYLPQLV